MDSFAAAYERGVCDAIIAKESGAEVPNLSGEWADGLTPQGLANLVEYDGDDIDGLCDAYEAGVDAIMEGTYAL